MQQSQNERRGGFGLGRWLVEPELNRVSDGAESVQLEPRVMDLLVFMAEHAGEVLPRQDILDAVWQQDFVGDTTLSSAVAVLRRALADDARRPRYIETIAKRGYRLVAQVIEAGAVATVTPFPGLALPPASSPYPGLASFSEADAEVFFGRTSEIAELWQKIAVHRMLAVIGPSGVGKSSFVRAGVVPAAAEGWGTLTFEPGEAPFNSLARALVPEFSGDAEAVQQLLDFNEADVALALISRWRERFDQVLLVVDQFEELFTLNPVEVQSRFAELLSRLVVAGRVHLVLVMRDDFLYQCRAHSGLAPVFKDLTALGPLAEEELLRSMVEPARRSGFSFEDEGLAGEMINEVACERGAMPMLAFAMARLWELRDTHKRQVTRRDYEAIGGVAGALAQHAEEVMGTIGEPLQPLVREIFRNLVTAQGTRAVREVGELLSIFAGAEQNAAAKVLQELVQGRLLTAFEVAVSGGDPGTGGHQVEIAHESLLSAWPRLVRWQTQDADAAQLRDQVRQAARLWHQHGRSQDLLWTGTAVYELELWRKSYPGGLSAVETEFVNLSVQLAGRRRRQRRVASAVAMLFLVVVAATVTGLWRRSANQARHAEARKLFHLGQMAVDQTPSYALSRAIASLEQAEDPDARRLAVQALWNGGNGLGLSSGGARMDNSTTVAFSPDGRWLAAGHYSGEVALWSSSGGEAIVWKAHESPGLVWWAPDSTALLTVGFAEPTYRFWSVPDGKPIGESPIPGWQPPTSVDWIPVYNLFRNMRVLAAPSASDGRWRADPSCEEVIRWLNTGGSKPGVISPSGELLAYAEGGALYVSSLGETGEPEALLVARHDQPFQQIAFHPDGDRVATVDLGGSLQLWSLDAASPGPIREWQSGTAERCAGLLFDPSGAFLVSAHGDGLLRIWGLDDPPDAGPVRRVADRIGINGVAFDPDGHWLAATGSSGTSIRPFERGRFGHVLRGHEGSVDDLAFAPDGSWLVSVSSDGSVRWWPLHRSVGDHARLLHHWRRSASYSGLSSVAVAPDGSFVVVAMGGANAVRVLSLDGQVLSELALPPGDVHNFALGPNGRYVAVGLVAATGGDGAGVLAGVHGELLVWDLVSGEMRRVTELPLHGTFQSLAFADDGSILAANGGLYRWDPVTLDHELVLEGIETFSLCRGGTVVLGARSTADGPWEVVVHDLVAGSLRVLASHGLIFGASNVSTMLAVDQECTMAATVNRMDVQVGLIAGEPPHLLLGHSDDVGAIAVSPDGRWIASGSRDKTIRLWPVPDLTRTPLHVLPRAELLDRLHLITRKRWLRDDSAPESFAFWRAPFPGWENVPEW